MTIVTMTIPLFSPSPLLLHCPIDPLVHLLHPDGELSVVKILLDQGKQEPISQFTFGHHSLDHSVILQVVADVCWLEHGNPQIREYQGQRPTEATDYGNQDEKEEPEPLHQKYLIIDNVETEDTERMVNVDGASEWSWRELTGRDGGEDLAHGVDQVLSDVRRGEQVVHRPGPQRVEHPGQEHVRGLDDGEQEQQLEYLTEEELGEVPVVLSERDDEGLHRVSPSVLLMIVVSDIV